MQPAIWYHLFLYLTKTASTITLHEDLISTLKQRGLKIAHQNIGSLPKNIDNLRLVASRCKELNILTLSETWLSDNIKSEEIEIPGFNVFRLDRNTGQRDGEDAAYISEKLSVVR